MEGPPVVQKKTEEIKEKRILMRKWRKKGRKGEPEQEEGMESERVKVCLCAFMQEIQGC